MRVLTIVAATLVLMACSKSSKDVKIDLSTPADYGKTLCALLSTGDVRRLGEVEPWENQIKGCNLTRRVTECGGAGRFVTFGCKSVPEGKAYPDCTQQKLQDEWKRYAAELSTSKSKCVVERPRSGKLDEIEIVTFGGTRDIVRLTKHSDGQWRQWSLDPVLLPKSQLAAMDARMQRGTDEESGFGKN